MSRKRAQACRDFCSRRSSRSWVVGFAVIAAVVVVLGFGAARANAVNCDPQPSFTTRPTLTQPTMLQEQSQSIQVGPSGQTLTLYEGSWVPGGSPPCPQITSISYSWYENGTQVGATGYFRTGGSVETSGGTATYPGGGIGGVTTSGDDGHAITAAVTACDSAQGCDTETVAFVPSDTAPTDPKIGVNSECAFNSTTTLYDEAAHSQWVRIFVDWNAYEPSQNSYNATFITNRQQCVQRLHAAGESVLVVMAHTPCWDTSAWVSGSCNTTTYTNNNLAASPPTNMQYFASAAQRLVSTDLGSTNACGTDTQTGKKLCGVQAFEVWNEEYFPNSNQNWTGTKTQYEQLLQSSYSPIPPKHIQMPTIIRSTFGSCLAPPVGGYRRGGRTVY